MKHILTLLLLPLSLLADDFARVTLSGRVNWSGDTTVPTLSSATVSANGTTLTLVFSEDVTRGSGWTTGDIDIDGSTSGANLSFSYSSGDGTTTWTGTLSATVYSGETLNLDFNGDANSIEDGGGNDVAAISSGAVTNNSTQSSITYLVNQGFEGTGYDNSETWTATGTVDADEASVFSVGSQSLEINSSASLDFVVSPAFSAQSTVYCRALIRYTGTPGSANDIFAFRASTSARLRVFLATDGRIGIDHGTTATTYTTAAVSADTWTYLWFRYTASTGGDNGVAEASFATSNSRPTTGTAYVTLTTGSETDSVTTLRIGIGSGTITRQFYVDDVKVAATGYAP